MNVRRLTGSYHLTEPRKKAGFRVVPLVPAMCELLQAWMKERPANPWGLVWPNALGGPANPVHDRDECYGLQDAVEVGHQAGRYYTVHDGSRGWSGSTCDP